MNRKPFGPALLPSETLNKRRATIHTYSHSQIMTVASSYKSGAPITGIAHFYRCTETLELRVWGFDRTYGKDNGGN